MESHDVEHEGRGPNAPGESLGTAIQLLHQIRDKLGFSSASRETVAEALGYSSLNGTSRRKIAVLSHFELLVRNGATYRVSEIGKQILMPRDEAECRMAVAAAARKPALYQKLFARYEGQALPGMLSNILVREYRTLPQTSEEVARTFRETMEFAGLVRNGVLLSEPEKVDGKPPETQVPNSPPLAGAQTQSPPNLLTPAVSDGGAGDGRHRQQYTIPLDKSGTLATVELPVPLRERDLKKLSAWANYMLTVFDDEETSEGD